MRPRPFSLLLSAIVATGGAVLPNVGAFSGPEPKIFAPSVFPGPGRRTLYYYHKNAYRRPRAKELARHEFEGVLTRQRLRAKYRQRMKQLKRAK